MVRIIVLHLAGALGLQQAWAQEMCATPAQAQRIQAFYEANPGTMPVIAARRLDLPEAVVVSGLPAPQAVSAPGTAFAHVWSAMTRWNEAVFLITKGANVFEILSPIAPGAPSTRSDYYNIEYKHPFRGHLRPDQYVSLYAISMPGKETTRVRGVLFYGADGASVFGAFISGEGPEPPQAELAKFDAVMAVVRSKPAVCGTRPVT
ncbi:MAG TPA: ChuX/HutX family heme-like substrate-binding protein [Steroidobacteraceae bacterium]|nr:ChuX/HutX family heme-like substrate-binding protein [Steroidobacteraceae bacterium]